MTKNAYTTVMVLGQNQKKHSIILGYEFSLKNNKIKCEKMLKIFHFVSYFGTLIGLVIKPIQNMIMVRFEKEKTEKAFILVMLFIKKNEK